MPSPIGHALGGALFGGLVATTPLTTPPARAAWWREAALLAGVGLLPDLDFLLGLHSRYTHSLGAVVAVGAAAWLLARRRPDWALAAAAAYASHILLDWLGTDTTPPIGIMALWPISDAFFQSDVGLFMAISRRYWLANFWSHNLTAVTWELILLGPPTALLWWGKRRGVRQ